MNYDALLLRIQTVGAAYLLGGSAPAAYVLIAWSVMGFFSLWR
jgi:hypothetical protein